MDPMDEYKTRIAALTQAMFRTKYIKEDNIPCKIEDVNGVWVT